MASGQQNQQQQQHTPSPSCAGASACRASEHIHQGCFHPGCQVTDHCSHPLVAHHRAPGMLQVPQSWANVVPLALLGRWTALVECPGCRGVAPTATKHKIGKGTHWMATMFFFTTGIGVFIPYVSQPFKDVEHSCLRCGRCLATKRFGGGTRAHLM